MSCRVGIRVRRLTRLAPQQTSGYATKSTAMAPAPGTKWPKLPTDETLAKSVEDFKVWRRTLAGKEYRENKPGKYASNAEDQPFPHNPLFKAEPVVDQSTRWLVHRWAMEEGKPIKVIAAQLGLDIRRVAAIVRLQETQKQWVEDGKALAKPYAKAVTGMLRTWHYDEAQPWNNAPFEPVNDIHIHRATMRQIFVSVAESRPFSRQDAADAFHGHILPVHRRSPQQGLIAMERKNLASPQDRTRHWKEYEEAERRQEEKLAGKLQAKAEKEEAATLRYRSDRFEFRIRDMNVDDAGRDGWARGGQGWRYGAPLQDRKKGIVKIPTSVP